MAHLFEPAASGRSKCRGCGRVLQRGELRFGERLPNPFAEGTELTLWFHPLCAAYKRPEAMMQALAEAPATLPDRETLERIAGTGAAHRRLPRIDGAERARGNARCRNCREPIARGSWRIRLAYFEEGQFHAAGFLHLDCARAYFETPDIVEPLLHFSSALDDAQREELRGACLGRGEAAS
ncbi:MAG: hypothetical protein ACM3SO_15435 [Betaproteobacteria bacterium]